MTIRIRLPLPRLAAGLCTAALLAAASAMAQASTATPAGDDFTIAVLPDTQNYVDATHQTEAGFPIDAREIFYDQLDYVARNAQSQGGDIAFMVLVGDVWQHASSPMDPAHAAMGLKRIDNPLLDGALPPDPKVVAKEMAVARAGFARIDGVLPFAVLPGNHDYDAFWSDSRFPPAKDYRNPGGNAYPFGQLHYGGLDNFRSVFGETSPLFKGKPWYAGSFNGGADSAVIFEAGGYRFLHLGLEMAPADDVLAWAAKMIAAHPGLPTIVSIHDHLNPDGERKPNPAVDFKLVQREHNNPEDLWRKFLSRHDQIFLVLSGHQHGQSHRTDSNGAGHAVHQILADYQDRNQIVADLADKLPPHAGLGDGWMRLMRFDLDAPEPKLTVSTYSTYYKSTAAQFPPYARYYKAKEKPKLTDETFIEEEEFILPLKGFKDRFSGARVDPAG
jgi:hypothetical protein